MNSRCDHVALLVRDLEAARQRLARLGLDEGTVGEYPGEGTRELYLGSPAAPGRLLLMQPLGDEGPYARALAKRGPGLHHVALAVPDPSDFAQDQPGWLAHPHTLQSLPEVAWLCRPGVGVLLEIIGAAGDADAPADDATVSCVEVELQRADAALLDQLGVAGTALKASQAGSWITIAGERLNASEVGA
jgi:catechol 2,3-dioxygenase-like lactoylglutathione lyase family enzyme